MLSLLGRGGMGEVWRADDLRLNQAVAIKFLPPALDGDPQRMSRLHEEVRLAREVAHPNVARVYDIGDAKGQPFITMEFVDGEDLASLLRRIGRPIPEKAAEIARQLCAGLHALHERGLLHLDLKPSNVMIDGRGRVRIMDFGLATRADAAGTSRSAGTPAYMAPEQWGGGELTPAADLYALGLILFELFTGRAAVSARSLQETRRWHAESTPQSLSASLSTVDDQVERVILRCLEKDPAARPATAMTVALMLPGGDPIAAALAAGETPSPEMVAAAGQAGRMGLPAACALAVVFVGAIAAWLVIPTTMRPWQFVTLSKPPQVLLDRGEQLLEAIGEPDMGGGEAWGYTVDRTVAAVIDRRTFEGSRQQLIQGSIDPVRFFLRRADRPLVANNSFGRVVPDDPPMEREGQALVVLSPNGQLRSLDVVPRRRDWPSSPLTIEQNAELEAKWSRLFAEAGLELERFEPSEPTRAPRRFADLVLAWNERPRADGDSVRRVEAAAFGGQVVLFAVEPAASEPSRSTAVDGASASSESSSTIDEVAVDSAGAPSAKARASSAPSQGLPLQVIGWITIGVMFSMIGLAAFLAIRHVRAGRGDRRGAVTIAMAVAIMAFLRWCLLCDPSLSPGFVNAFLGSGVALALLSAGLAALLYLALEPIGRRLLPSTLITWQRLLQGRWSDPLLGRDVLIGSVAGAFILLVTTLGVELERIGGAPRIEFGASWITPWLYGLAGGRRVIGLLLLALQSGVIAPMSILLVLVVLRLLLRRLWVAVAVFLACFAVLHATSASMPLAGAAAGLVTGVIVIGTLIRFGLVALLAAQVVAALLTVLPVTLDASQWYFSNGLAAVAAALVIAGFGFWAATSGRATPAWMAGRAGGASTPAAP